MALKTKTKEGQDDARELGKAAGRSGASKRLRDSLKKKHCQTPQEEEEFDKGVKEGEKEG